MGYGRVRCKWSPLLAAVLCAAAASPCRAQDARDDPALSLDIVYSAEVAGVATGGAERGARYLDNLDVVAEADLERTIGWKGARAKLYALYNNGTALRPLVGDSFATSNIETGVRALRLYEAWIEQSIGPALSVRFGLYDLNSEFDALPAADVFLSSAHGIGTDIGQSGRNGPSIFPSTSLGLRVAWRASDDAALRLAVLDGVPGDPARPSRTAIKLGKGDGALIVGEGERRFGALRLVAGAWHYTSGLDRFDGSTGSASGAYLRGEAQLTREAGDRDQGLSAFARLGIADSRVHRVERFASFGLSYRGLLPGRDADVAGIAVATNVLSQGYRQATGVGPTETGLELTYRARLADWLTVQPDVQYVLNPAGAAATANALVLALRVEIAWGAAR